jgi:hypothetical protein
MVPFGSVLALNVGSVCAARCAKQNVATTRKKPAALDGRRVYDRHPRVLIPNQTFTCKANAPAIFDKT